MAYRQKSWNAIRPNIQGRIAGQIVYNPVVQNMGNYDEKVSARHIIADTIRSCGVNGPIRPEPGGRFTGRRTGL